MIFTPIITESWLGREVNMINFSSILELYTMRVIDGGITLLSAISDIQPLMIELRKVQIKYNIPSVIFVGEIEKKGANFFALVQQIKGRLTTVPLVTQLPIYEEDKFIGLIDLIAMKELIWEKVTDDEYYLPYYRDRFTEYEIREELINQAIEYHNKIIEQIVEVDGNENLMEKFLEDREITPEEMVEGIRIATVAMAVTPIFIGCVSSNKGIRKLLNGVIDYLPAPSSTFQAENIDTNKKVTLQTKENEPFVGVVFDINTDPFVGELSIVRIYRGSLKSDTYIYNSTQNKKEKVNRILKCYSIRREEVSEVFAGEIAYVNGLKAKIGDTLCDPNHKIILEKIKTLEPVFFVKIKIIDESCKNGIAEYAFRQLSRENLSCRIAYQESLCDPIFIYGDSKIALKEIIHRLKNEFRLDISNDEPQMIYYQTIKTALEKEYIYQKHSTNYHKKVFAHICLKLEAQKRGEGYKFVDKIKGGVVPYEFIYHINHGIQKALREGVDGSYPVVDIKVILYNGSYHDIHSNNEAFETAGYIATKEALREANLVLLEPIMRLNIEVEENLRGVVLADITKRRGIACGRGGDKYNTGDIFVPLSEILDYDNELYKLTNGRASYVCEVDHYEEVPDYLRKISN
jgi:elongation factor G